MTALDSRSRTGAVRWVACVINNPMRTKHQSCDESETSVKGVGERYKKKRLHPNFTLPHTLATLFCSRNNRSLTAARECLLQWRIQGRGLVPLFLDQTEARRAEKSFFGDRAPLVSLGLDDRPPPLSEGLDPPLYCAGSVQEEETMKLRDQAALPIMYIAEHCKRGSA